MTIAAQWREAYMAGRSACLARLFDDANPYRGSDPESFEGSLARFWMDGYQAAIPDVKPLPRT